ncbi:hypothetical protein RPMA_15450 [Tardiphaga alba]|uniref:SPOR domain-containing protein n=1 Tax=Tardiphaga alba TaxID=340268 RepID=A0ABX8AE24_9BRAD|nr:hypothetical protein [Tardiphaga alba]QUS40070.1 hypothetical protein RPMA_15450 [Tardiphaga alba]
MADKRDQWADSFSAEPQGLLTGFLADEDKGGRRLMWRLGSWGVAAIGAVSLAVVSSQYQLQLRHDQVVASDSIARQAQQLQQLTKEAQVENRRLTHAIETLNGDRDRLFARVTSIEQGLDSVTGSIKRQAAAVVVPKPVTPEPAAEPVSTAAIPTEPVPATLPAIPFVPVVAPVASTPPQDEPAKVTTAAILAPEPTPEAPPAIEVAATAVVQPEVVATPVSRTEFGVDIGGANSVDGLRAIWRGMSKSRALSGLRPIITVRERSNGLGMQLRLVAGPLTDAAAAAQICAALIETKRPCETSTFDGQRLALKNEAEPAAAAPVVPKPPRPAQRRAAPKPEPAPAPKPEQRSEPSPPPRPVEEAQAQAPEPKPTPSLRTLLGFSRE